VLSAHRVEEKRFSIPYQHLSKDESKSIVPVELQPSMITKYNYVGVPAYSRHDERAQPVKLRKKLMDD
jgi:hypothetical protein